MNLLLEKNCNPSKVNVDIFLNEKFFVYVSPNHSLGRFALCKNVWRVRGVIASKKENIFDDGVISNIYSKGIS